MTTIVGKPLPRVDARGKVTGETLYSGDLTRKGMLHMKILFAGRPHAVIRSIDTTAAEALPAKVRRSAGQRSRQLKHKTHSPPMICPEGRQAPSQYCSQMQQSPHLSEVLPIRQGVKRLRRPNSAPRGQTNRQKNRWLQIHPIRIFLSLGKTQHNQQ